MDFYQFVENWTMRYRAMLHQPGLYSKNCRFYLTDTYMGLADFMHNINPEHSPCVVMESAQQGEIIRGKDQPQYTIYFMVRAADMADGRLALLAKKEAKTHLHHFLAWTIKHKEEGNPILRNIDIESRNSYESIGPLYDGWYGVYITLTDTLVYDMCVHPEDYLPEPDDPDPCQQEMEL